MLNKEIIQEIKDTTMRVVTKFNGYVAFSARALALAVHYETLMEHAIDSKQKDNISLAVLGLYEILLKDMENSKRMCDTERGEVMPLVQELINDKKRESQPNPLDRIFEEHGTFVLSIEDAYQPTPESLASL